MNNSQKLRWLQARLLVLILLSGIMASGSDLVTADTSIEELATVSSQWGWVRYSAPTTEMLRDVAVVSADNVWAVGSNGTILHWNGYEWSQVPSPSNAELLSITMIPSPIGDGQVIDGWIVGWDATILRWQENAWVSVPSPIHGDFVEASVVISPTQAGGWTTEGWAIGLGASLRWHNDAWERFEELDHKYLYSLSMLSPVDAMAVGSLGIMGRWDGQHWSGMSCPSCLDPYMLSSVSMVSHNSAWAVGSGAFLHFNGTDWQRLDGVAAPVDEISMMSDTYGWGVDNWSGVIAHWDGTGWRRVVNPSGRGLHAVEMVPPSQGEIVPQDGWIVGEGGTILRYARTNSSYLPMIMARRWHQAGSIAESISTSQIVPSHSQHDWPMARQLTTTPTYATFPHNRTRTGDDGDE